MLIKWDAISSFLCDIMTKDWKSVNEWKLHGMLWKHSRKHKNIPLIACFLKMQLLMYKRFQVILLELSFCVSMIKIIRSFQTIFFVSLSHYLFIFFIIKGIWNIFFLINSVNGVRLMRQRILYTGKYGIYCSKFSSKLISWVFN